MQTPALQRLLDAIDREFSEGQLRARLIRRAMLTTLRDANLPCGEYASCAEFMLTAGFTAAEIIEHLEDVIKVERIRSAGLLMDLD